MKNISFSFLILTISVISVPFSFAQNRTIDTLLNLIKIDKPDTNKVNHLILLSNEYRQIGDYDNGLKYGHKALQLATDKPDRFAMQQGSASAYNTIGNIYYNQGNYPEALKNYVASLQINEVLKNKKDIAGAYHNIGIIYYYLHNYPEALKNYYAALNLREEIGDKQGIANAYNNIGNIYDDPENYLEAIKNYSASLKIYEEIGGKQGIANSYSNIGTIYDIPDHYPEALNNYIAALKIYEEIGDKQNIAGSFLNIGTNYYNQNNYQKALKNYSAGLKIYEQIDDKTGIAQSFVNLGLVNIKLNKLKKAQIYLNKALQLSTEIGSKEWMKESYNGLVDFDSTQGNWKSAYQHHKLFILYRDSITFEETKQNKIISAMNSDMERKQAEKDKKDEVEAANKKTLQIVLILASCSLLLVFARFIFRSKCK